MKIKCQSCHDTFDIPDGKGITRAVCPFCDHANDLRDTQTPRPSMPFLAAADQPTHRPSAHPLAPQFWILAICAAIVTAIICISFLFTVVAMIEQGKENQKAAEEIGKMTDEFNRSMEKANKAAEEANRAAAKAGKDAQQALQKLLKP